MHNVVILPLYITVQELLGNVCIHILIVLLIFFMPLTLIIVFMPSIYILIKNVNGLKFNCRIVNLQTPVLVLFLFSEASFISWCTNIF